MAQRSATQYPTSSEIAVKNLLLAPFKNKAKVKSADLYIYGDIGPWDDWGQVSAKSVIAAIKEIGQAETLNIRVNSVGGDVFEGIAIYRQLTQYSGNVVVHIDGIAASIASIIAMAGNTVKMGDNAQIMIHNPSGVIGGDHRAIAKYLDLLVKTKETLVDTYRKKTKTSRDTLSAWMDDETWFRAADALKYGFVDEVVGSTEDPELDNRSVVILAGYKKTPKEILPSQSLVAKAKLASMQMAIKRGGITA